MDARPTRNASTVAGLRVLLVEDNPVNQEVAREHLIELGCSVTVCSHGGEALAMFKRARFDLVLMDYQMPVMDGYEATRHICIFEQEQQVSLPQSRTPNVALTANALKGDRDRCLLAGMDDFLPKPFRLIDLQQMLARWNKRNEPPAAASLSEAEVRPAAVIDEKVWQQIQVLAARSSGFQARVLGALTVEAGKLEAALLDTVERSGVHCAPRQIVGQFNWRAAPGRLARAARNGGARGCRCRIEQQHSTTCRREPGDSHSLRPPGHDGRTASSNRIAA